MSAPGLALKPDLAEAEKRWLAFWEGEIVDRPCCMVRAPADGAGGDANGGTVPRIAAPRYMAGARGDLDEVAERVLAHARSLYWGGEAVPSYTPSFGPDMFAAWLGSELRFPEEEYGTSWAVARVEDWDRDLPLRLDEQGYWWRRMLAFCERLAARFAGQMLVAHLDLHSNLDALLALRGGQRLCLDLIDCPETVDRAMAQVRALYPVIDQSLRRAGRMTRSCGWIPFYHPERTNVIQCDFAALIGPAHFRRWGLPALAEEAAHLGRCAMHYDGPQMLVHLDDICAIPQLRCIQWQPGAGNRPFSDWLELLVEIQRRGVAVYVPCPVSDLQRYHRELKPELVCYHCWAPSRREAERALRWLTDNT